MKRIPFFVLALMVIINLGRGSIHAFSPDGGAHSIAGLDLTTGRQTILSLFALMGLQQVVTGLFELFVLLRRPDLVAMALGLQTALTAAGVANLYFWRTLPVAVPGAPFNAGLLIVVLVAFLVAVLQTSQPTSQGSA